MEKNWAHSVDQCQLQALQLFSSAYNLLSILLRCNGLAGTQKARVVKRRADHQTMTMTFFWCKFDFGKCFGASSQSNPLSWSLPVFFFFIKSTLCCTSQSEKWFAVVMQNKRKWHFKTRHPLIELFHLSNLLQMPNGYRMVDTEFFCNFLCSCYKDQLRWLLSIGHCQLLMAGHYTPDLKGSCLLCKTSWTTTALYVC